MPTAYRSFALMLTAAALAAGCSDDGTSFQNPQQLSCDLDMRFLASGGVGIDAIPALTNPGTVAIDDPSVAFLREDNRVIGIVLHGEPIAIPHNVLWWHEIVNLDAGGTRVAVTYCPLTGTSMGFDRAKADGAELGVSGLLFQSNLVMYDRNRPDISHWPQIMGESRCGPRTGTILDAVAVLETTWAGWKSLYPNTRVIFGDPQGGNQNYRVFPYGNYEDLNNPNYFQPFPELDSRRPPKERVLGIPGRNGDLATAFPFNDLDEEGSLTVRHRTHGGEDIVVLWDGVRRGAMAYRARLNGAPVTLAPDGIHGFRDAETGSLWLLNGRAVEGPMAAQGAALEPVPDAIVAFWGAWAAFHPESRVDLL